MAPYGTVTCDLRLLVSLADGFNRDNRDESLLFVKLSKRRKITYTPNTLPYRATMTVVETALLDNPDNIAIEVRTFLAQYVDRAQQQARKTAAAVLEGATVGSWVTFGVLLLTLVVSILETMAGIPNLHT